MMIKLFHCFILLCLSLQVSAFTGDSTNYLTTKDTIFLELGENGKKIFKHILEPKQTLYSLAQFYNISMQELYFYNPSLKDRMPRVKEAIRVPIPHRAIYRYEDNLNPSLHIPVYFIVGKGQTLYTISNTYFRMSVEQMKRRNNLTTDNIEEGKLLFIGWMNIKGVPLETRRDEPEISNNPILKEYYENKNTYLSNCMVKTEWEHKGLAKVTTQGSMKTTSLVALHDHAPINSIIRIENPSEKKHIYAKVIGRIPASLEEDNANVIIVVSETVSQLLMIIDKRFFAEVKYLK